MDPRVGVDLMLKKNSEPTGNLIPTIRPFVSHFTDGNVLILRLFED
jgi:hypothetical protein